MVNKLILVGNVGRDPEIKNLHGGGQKMSFGLATSERWKDKESGERKERTQWHNVVVWNKALIEAVGKHIKKGSKLYVEGKLMSREYTDKDGNKRYAYECVLNGFGDAIVLCDRSEGGGNRPPENDDPDAYGVSSSKPASSGSREDFDDEIPF